MSNSERDDAPHEPSPWGLVGAGTVAALIALAATAPLALHTHDRNEEMYLAAAALIRGGAVPYLDFPFLQTPGWPAVLAAAFAVVPASFSIYAVAKATLLVTAAIGAFLTGILCAVLSRSVPVGAVFAGALFCAPPVVQANIDASNYALGLTLTAAATLAVLRASSEGARSAASLLAGALIGLAACAKSYHLLLAPIALGAILLAARRGHVKPTLHAAAFAAGGLLGGLPVLILLAADFTSVWYQNVGFHADNVAWSVEVALTRGVGTEAKLEELASWFVRPPVATLVVASALAMAVGVVRARSTASTGASRTLLLLGLTTTALVAAMLPSPTYDQYLAFPTLLLGATFAAALGRTGNPAVRVALAVTVCAVFASAALPGWRHVTALADDRATQVEIRREIRDRLAPWAARLPAGCPTATLAPATALDAGLTIYPELATGNFLWNTFDRSVPEMRGNTPAVGRDSVGPLFSRSPPCALLLGMERRFDEIPLLEAARSFAAYRPVIAESDLVFAVREDLLPQR